MLDELRALAIFAKVVEDGSFRGAARRLALSPSVVSHHVRTLEERVGVALLHRSTRRLVLTPAGERLVAEAQAMVASAERGLDQARGLSAIPSGSLRLTIPAFLAETSLCADIAAFARAHPAVRLMVSFSEVPRDLLNDGFDLALRIGTLADSTHKTRKLSEMRRVLVAAPSLAASQPPLSAPRDLKGWPFLHLGSRAPTLAMRHRAQAAQVTYAPVLTVDSAGAMRRLMLAGAGLATLPEVLVQGDLKEGRAVEILPAWRVATVAVHALWPGGAVKPTLTLRFLDFITPRIEALFAPPVARLRRPRG